MTALEFVAEGVRFRREAGSLRVAGPKGRPDLVKALRREVECRIGRVRELAPDRHAPFGRCETCGDAMQPYRGGMCELCVAARQKALELAGVPRP